MPMAAIRAYLNQLPAMRAEMKMLLADGASVPHLEENARSRVLRQWQQDALGRMEPETSSKKGIVANAAVLAMMGIGMRGRKEDLSTNNTNEHE